MAGTSNPGISTTRSGSPSDHSGHVRFSSASGSPRGTGGDPLAELKRTWPEWSLGQPDLIVEIPAFDVPATGTIPYQMPSATNPLDHDVWVRAVDFQPGDRTVLHHIIATMGADGAGIREGGSLGGYVPGAGPMVLPTETGILMKKDAKFFFQMHYTATGKAARDVSRMGLYFRKDAPEYQFRSAVMAKPSLKIPANTKAHTESASRTRNVTSPPKPFIVRRAMSKSRWLSNPG